MRKVFHIILIVLISLIIWPSYCLADEVFDLTGYKGNSYKQFESDDLKVNDLALEIIEDKLEFIISYESAKVRDICVFNPPDGDHFKKILNDVIKPGKQTVRVRVDLAEFKNLNDVTINFFGDGDDNFICIDKVSDIDFDALPFYREIIMQNADAKLVDGNTMIPMRAIFEVLGYDVKWDPASNSILAESIDRRIALQLNSKEAFINDKPETMAAAPIIINNSTYVPFRFLGEASGHLVNWNFTNQYAEIKTDNTIYIVQVDN